MHLHAVAGYIGGSARISQLAEKKDHELVYKVSHCRCAQKQRCHMCQ